jgi:Tol biopolymer transport system component
VKSPIFHASCAAVLCAISLAPAGAAAKRAVTIEDLYRLKEPSSISLVPGSGAAVFALKTSDLPKAKQTTHLWIMDADGTRPRQLTFGEQGESSPAVSRDGKWIAFVSSRDGAANVYVLPMEGGEARKLTSISTGAADPVWSPDGKWIAFASDVYPECGADDACNKKTAERWSKGKLQAHMASALLYRHWTEWKDGKRTHILLADASSGAVRDLTPGDFDSPPFQLGGPVAYDFSPDGSELAFVSNHDRNPASSTNGDIWLLPLSGKGEARNITASNPAYDGSPKYSPDGRYIAYRMQKQPAYESDLFRLAVYDRSSGTSRILTESYSNWVDDFQWAPDSRALYFSGPLEGNIPISRVDLAEGGIKRVLTDCAIAEFAISREGNRVVYVRSSVGEPREIFGATLAGGAAGTPRRI